MFRFYIAQIVKHHKSFTTSTKVMGNKCLKTSSMHWTVFLYKDETWTHIIAPQKYLGRIILIIKCRIGKTKVSHSTKPSEKSLSDEKFKNTQNWKISKMDWLVGITMSVQPEDTLVGKIYL